MRRLIRNVRLLADRGEARATANFAVWRFQHDRAEVYIGRSLNGWCAAPPASCFASGGRCSTSKPCARAAS
jgi:hypothetical protein